MGARSDVPERRCDGRRCAARTRACASIGAGDHVPRAVAWHVQIPVQCHLLRQGFAGEDAMISRRELFMSTLAASLAGAAAAQPRSSKKMTLSIHQNTSRGAGYRKSLEGWAKAGIKFVEITDTMLDEFLRTDTLAAAKSVVTDLGLTPVSSAAVLQDIWIPGPARAASLETWKRRCEQFSTIGLQKIY